MNRFLHSGRYGDLIYSLWTIKALSGGSIVFNLSEGSLVSEENVRFCRSLLESLSYISSVETIKFRKELENNRGEKLFCRQDVDNPDLLILDNAWYWRNYPETYHWIYRYAYTFGVEVDASTPVIQVSSKNIRHRPIIVHSTDRYRGSGIPQEFLNREDVLIVTNEFYNSMLEMAISIASSKFFVGNQSIGAALAQALQHPRLIEKPSNPFWHDAYPIGKHGFSFDSDFDSKLEIVSATSEEFWSQKK